MNILHNISWDIVILVFLILLFLLVFNNKLDTFEIDLKKFFIRINLSKLNGKNKTEDTFLYINNYQSYIFKINKISFNFYNKVLIFLRKNHIIDKTESEIESLIIKRSKEIYVLINKELKKLNIEVDYDIINTFVYDLYTKIYNSYKEYLKNSYDITDEIKESKKNLIVVDNNQKYYSIIENNLEYLNTLLIDFNNTLINKYKDFVNK